VFPAGGEHASLNRWVEAHSRGTFAPFLELARWCHYSKGSPHQGGTKVQRRLGELYVSNGRSVHLNVQAFVSDTRWRCRNRLVTATPTPSKRVPVLVTHGFRAPERYVWGWSAHVRLTFTAEAQQYFTAERPSFYLRKFYQLDYAFPIPHADEYYAGTATVSQRTPKELDAAGKFLRWQERTLEKLAGVVTAIEVVEPARNCWRPVAPAGQALIYRLAPFHWGIRPQGGNGFRHWWDTLKALQIPGVVP
jgi:hypothetical protein